MVRHDEDGRAMLAVIDGLGHGPGAAEASQAAIGRLEALSLETRVLDAMHALHQDLRKTRGAAATLCMINKRRMEVCAVGNVQLLSSNCVVPLVVSSGVLGHYVSKFRVCESELKLGARVALLSDGIPNKLRLEEVRRLSPTEACKLIMHRYRSGDDDATVLVADMSS